MNKRDVISIAVKFLGVIIFAYTVIDIPNYISQILYIKKSIDYPAPAEASSMMTSTILYLITRIVVGVVLMLMADAFARKLVKNDSELILLSDEFNRRSVFVLALQIFGVIVLAHAIPDLIYVVFNLVSSKHASSPIEMFNMIFKFNASTAEWNQLTSKIASLIIGIYLVSGARYLVNLLYGGASKESVQEAV